MKIVIDRNGTPHNDDTDVDPIVAKQENGLYYVLASNDGDLFSPITIGINVHKKDLTRGCPFWSLRPCSHECYEQYTSFLRSKNKTHYLIAQRRYCNDSIGFKG